MQIMDLADENFHYITAIAKPEIEKLIKDTVIQPSFHTMKRVFLEMRGVLVHKANRKRAHVFIIMLTYLLAYQLGRLWIDAELTDEEGIKELASICSI